jgi:hypothetical protein
MNVIAMSANPDGIAVQAFAYSSYVFEERYFYGIIN